MANDSFRFKSFLYDSFKNEFTTAKMWTSRIIGLLWSIPMSIVSPLEIGSWTAFAIVVTYFFSYLVSLVLTITFNGLWYCLREKKGIYKKCSWTEIDSLRENFNMNKKLDNILIVVFCGIFGLGIAIGIWLGVLGL